MWIGTDTATGAMLQQRQTLLQGLVCSHHRVQALLTERLAMAKVRLESTLAFGVEPLPIGLQLDQPPMCERNEILRSCVRRHGYHGLVEL